MDSAPSTPTSSIQPLATLPGVLDAHQARARFEANLEAAHTQLLARARRLCPADPEDLVQETLTRALRFRDRFDPSQALQPWLTQIMTRLQIDRLRRNARAQVATLETQVEAPAPSSLDETDQIDHLLGHLDEPGRSLLRRFHQDGDSLQQLSRSFRMPIGSIKSHLHRARRKLAERFTLGPDQTLESKP